MGHVAETESLSVLSSATRKTLAQVCREMRAVKHGKNVPIVICEDDAITSLDGLVDMGHKFQTVYADPPWSYGNQGTRAATNNHYGGLTVEEICAFPVAQLAADKSHLHLWTTNAFLFEAKRVMEAWGFEYKSVMLWIKPQLGLGNYWRVCHEFLLFGNRGGLSMGDARKTIKSWRQVDRMAHSEKPEEFRRLIESVSFAPRLEMFGRKVMPGWTVFGNEIVGYELYGKRI